MDKLWTNIALFNQTNYATLRKNPDIAENTSACNKWGSTLGALGRRIESYRPDSYNPSNRIFSKAFFFIRKFCPQGLQTNCGKRCLVER